MENNIAFGATSKVTRVNDLIYKEVIYGPMTNELIVREMYWLLRLEKYNISPKFIKRVDNTIIMTYSGEHMNLDDLKSDINQKQLIRIMRILMENYCFYNDFKLDNILIQDGIIKLIDFGWCPLIREDYGCGGLIESNLKSKPAGNFFTLFDVFNTK